MVVSGCALFKTKNQSSADLNSARKFTPRVAATSNAVAVPIEIASDISAIMSDDAVPNREVASDGQMQVAPADENPEEVAPADSEEPETNNSAKPYGKRHHKAGEHFKDTVYTVRSGDTLMKIAFEKYGNLYRWREILDNNQKTLGHKTLLSPGMVLHIAGSDYVVVEKNGQPYLIRRADTLAKISASVYGTPAQWRSLWKNNPQLIQNPNKIYTGFTLYYQPKGQ